MSALVPGSRFFALAAWTLGLSLAGSGCGGDKDFLYFEPVRPSADWQRVKNSYKLSEIVSVDQLDILWVIDNSGSMQQHQNGVIQNTKAFMDNFTTNRVLDWKMGLLSTDTRNAPYVGFTPDKVLNWRTRNPVGLFQSEVGRLGTGGSATEQTFDPIMKAIGDFPDFLRRRARLALIFVTDAKEQSKTSAADFLKWLGKVKGRLSLVNTYAVLEAYDMGCTSSGEGRWDYSGSPYEQVVKATDGKAYKLCDQQYGRDLSDIGKDLLRRLEKPKIHLQTRPKPRSIVVRFKGKVLPGGRKEDGGYWLYDYENNAIVFHDLDFAPNESDTVEIEVDPDDGYRDDLDPLDYGREDSGANAGSGSGSPTP